jgi:sortase A
MKLHIRIPAIVPRTVVRYFLLGLGITCLAIYGYAWLERELFQSYESREFDRMPDRVAAVVPSDNPITPIGSRAGRPSRSSVSPSRRLSPTALVGRLTVPRLHLSVMVHEGIDSNTLQLAVGHIPATALPGQAGNVGVAGHRDTFFRGLKDLRSKDEVRFSTLNGDFKYVVESLIIVEPDNVGVLASSTGNVLTMVTCYPFSYVGNAPKRFVARARQVSPSTVE